MNMKDAVSDWEHVSNMLKHLGQAPCKTTQRLQGQLNKPPPSSAPSTAPRALFAVTTLCAGVWLEVPKHLRQTGLWFALGQISNYVGLQRVIIRWHRPLMRWRDNWFIQAKKTQWQTLPPFQSMVVPGPCHSQTVMIEQNPMGWSRLGLNSIRLSLSPTPTRSTRLFQGVSRLGLQWPPEFAEV